jgi:DNA ligase (NAD+)
MEDIKHLETQYLNAKIAYYEGNPIMSDIVFDILEQKLKDSNSKVVEQIGSKRKDFDFPHPNPMLSLAKFQTDSSDYKESEFMNWLQKRENHANQLNFSIDHLNYSPKFDGSAINIIYRNRKLNAVLTRGDGKSGKNVTDRFTQYLPEYIEISGNVVEIRCEAVMRKSIFEKKYSKDFANARNIVAGIIGKDDIDKDKVKDITLIPIHLLSDGKHLEIEETYKIIKNCEIFSISHSAKCRPTKGDYLNRMKYMEDLRERFEFQLDGVVFSLPTNIREIFGENDHDPEWAIAIKFVPDEVITEVTGIEWNLGKTGELTPVILLKPVQLAGTTVKRASGYNAGYIINNKIGKGSFVDIHKSGDIIPEIGKIHSFGKVIDLPCICPSCRTKLKFDGIHLTCNNDNCVGRIARKLGSAAAMLDLKGIGGRTLEPFAKDFKNMYELMYSVLNPSPECGIDYDEYGIKQGSRSLEIFYDAFRNIKSLTYAQVILMMGYDGVGKKLAEQIAREYCKLEPNYKGHEKALVDKLHKPEIVTYIKSAVKALESFGVIVDKPEDTKDSNTIYVCMTGSPSPISKTKEEFISQFPNVEEVSVTDSKCDYLITDSLTSTSSKMKNAQKREIKIVTYKEFKI